MFLLPSLPSPPLPSDSITLNQPIRRWRPTDGDSGARRRPQEEVAAGGDDDDDGDSTTPAASHFNPQIEIGNS